MNNEEMNIDAPTRRWLQFRLRTLLIVVTLSAIAFAWYGQRLRETRRQQQAIDRLRICGVNFISFVRRPSDELSLSIVGGHSFSSKDILWRGTTTDLQELQNVGPVDYLALNLPLNAAEDLRFLEHMPSLRSLFINTKFEARLAPKYTERIAARRDLEELFLWDWSLPEEALPPLVGLKRLKSLGLCSRKISRASLDHICQMKSLEQLEIMLLDASDEDLRRFLALSNLKRIRVNGEGITDEGRQWLVNNHPTCSEVISLSEQFAEHRDESRAVDVVSTQAAAGLWNYCTGRRAASGTLSSDLTNTTHLHLGDFEP